MTDLRDILQRGGPNDLRDLTGEVLGGRFLLEARLAIGGTATIYRALDRRLHLPVAVKILHQASAKEFQQRLRQEALLSAHLSSPHLLRVIDQNWGNASNYIVFELVEGVPLTTLLSTPMLWQRAVGLIAQVLEALKVLHRRGVVHRDISPNNVLVGPNDHVWLIDLGYAKVLESDKFPWTVPPIQSSLHEMYGTDGYIAPERFVSQNEALNSDVYAVGALWHALVIGSPPRDHLHPNGGAFYVSAPMPVRLKLVLQTALTDILHRYPTAAEMALALEEAMQPIDEASDDPNDDIDEALQTATRSGTTHTPARSRGPRRWIATTMAGVAVTAIVTSLVTYRYAAPAIAEPIAAVVDTTAVVAEPIAAELCAAPMVGERIEPIVAEPIATEPIAAEQAVAKPVHRASPRPAKPRPRTLAGVMAALEGKIRDCFGDVPQPEPLTMHMAFDPAGGVKALDVARLGRASPVTQCITNVVATASPPADGKMMVKHTFSRK